MWLYDCPNSWIRQKKRFGFKYERITFRSANVDSMMKKMFRQLEPYKQIRFWKLKLSQNNICRKRKLKKMDLLNRLDFSWLLFQNEIIVEQVPYVNSFWSNDVTKKDLPTAGVSNFRQGTKRNSGQNGTSERQETNRRYRFCLPTYGNNVFWTVMRV